MVMIILGIICILSITKYVFFTLKFELREHNRARDDNYSNTFLQFLGKIGEMAEHLHMFISALIKSVNFKKFTNTPK